MKKLILFIHGLGGDEKTWGEFPNIIKQDSELHGYHAKIYTYPTSLIRAKNIVSFFSKPLSWFTPQSKLPKIQEIAQGLKTEIEQRYKKYDDIYLITHSMGGLVAKKYLIDEINLYKRKDLRVKKLLLYAVPNNGSNWALLAKLYNHEQIEQLNKNSDFIEFLNTESAILNLEDHVDTLYVIGTQDEVVDRQSAQARWANKNSAALHKAHMNIVKPVNKDDLSYIVFKNFVLKKLETKKRVNQPKDTNGANQNIHITTNNTINQTNNSALSTQKSKDGHFNKIVGIFTIIGVIITGIALFKSSTPTDYQTYEINQSSDINGSHNNVIQTINNGISQKEICKDSEVLYKKTISDLKIEIKNTSQSAQKKELKNELQQYVQKLKDYQKECIKGE